MRRLCGGVSSRPAGPHAHADARAGIPFSDVNLRTHDTRQPEWTAFSSLSEATTLSLEFATLAQAAGARPPGAPDARLG